MTEKTIFIGEYSKNMNIGINENVENYYPHIPRINECIKRAIIFAKSFGADIHLVESHKRIQIRLFLKFGMFFGDTKKEFINLVDSVDDFFIFPVEDKNEIEIALCLNKQERTYSLS